MKSSYLAAIEDCYDIKIVDQKPGPRQFVAETHILTDPNGIKYFCKIVDKPIFIPRIIASLPTLDEMHQLGVNFINYPIKTTRGDFHVMMDDGSLLVLLNYIDAPQNYEYDPFVLGQRIGQIHDLTPQLKMKIPAEDFILAHQFYFEDPMWSIVPETNDDVASSVKKLLEKYREEVSLYFSNFTQLSKKLRNANHNLVITHSDFPGNTLVKTPTEIYIVDWDEIRLAPAERDTWFLEDRPDFLQGYRTVFPSYQVNQRLRQFFIYLRYLNDVAEYLVEVNTHHSDDHRQKNLDALAVFFEGWLAPTVRNLS